jgi:hypothetical protein
MMCPTDKCFIVNNLDQDCVQQTSVLYTIDTVIHLIYSRSPPYNWNIAKSDMTESYDFDIIFNSVDGW